MVRSRSVPRIFRTQHPTRSGFINVHLPFSPRGSGLITISRFAAPLHVPPVTAVPLPTVNSEASQHSQGVEGNMDVAHTMPKRSKYQVEQALVSEKWQSLRSSMRDRLTELSYPATFVCYLCQKTPEHNQINRCKDCGPMAYFCNDCCIQQHRASLHFVEEWNEENHRFQKKWFHTVWKRPDRHSERCTTTKQMPIIIIDDRGRQHLQYVQFCACEERAVTLIRYGLWPCSPSVPTVAFSLDLMLTVRALVLEGQISLSSFCHGVQWYRIHMRQAEWFSDISRLLRWEVLLRFMELHHDTSNFDCIPNVTKSTQCMACPEVRNKPKPRGRKRQGTPVKEKNSGTDKKKKHNSTAKGVVNVKEVNVAKRTVIKEKGIKGRKVGVKKTAEAMKEAKDVKSRGKTLPKGKSQENVVPGRRNTRRVAKQNARKDGRDAD